MHSLTKTVSVPGVACAAGSIGIESAYGLPVKYWSTSSTKTGTRVGVEVSSGYCKGEIM